jgi:hypothetical protein
MADKSASFFKHETLFSGIRGYSELLARYRLSSYILLKGGYRFDVFQTTSWDYLISASDGFVLQLVALL